MVLEAHMWQSSQCVLTWQMGERAPQGLFYKVMNLPHDDSITMM